MGHVFQAEWWEKHPGGRSFWFIMAKENGKSFWKAKMAFLAHLFMKIKEIRKKEGERS